MLDRLTEPASSHRHTRGKRQINVFYLLYSVQFSELMDPLEEEKETLFTLCYLGNLQGLMLLGCSTQVYIYRIFCSLYCSCNSSHQAAKGQMYL